MVETVLLDSVQSQANRLEQALLAAFDSGDLSLPVLSVTIPRAVGVTRVTALDAPHRVWDAVFRDSLWAGKPFRKSPEGERLTKSRPENAAAFYEYCPTALVFGMWDSTGGEGATGAVKLARALVSEVVGLDAVYGRKTSSRIDPLAILSDAAKVYRSDDDIWTLDEAQAAKEKGRAVPFGKAGKAGKPSAINHGNVTPSISGDDESGGVTISEAVQATVLSFPPLRRLRFPDPATGASGEGRDGAGWVTLAALALYAVALQRRDGYFLRSRCHLVPLAPPRCEILSATAQGVETFGLTVDAARQTFDGAHRAAEGAGLTWRNGLTELTPADKLVELVRRSDAKLRVEGDDTDAGA